MIEEPKSYQTLITYNSENYVISIVSDLCKLTQKLNFDLFNCADNLYKKKAYEWKSYHDIVGDDGYVGDINYKVTCEVNNLY